MISFFKRMLIVVTLGVFVVSFVEFALIQKHGATLRTLLIVIVTTTIPVIIAILVNIKYWFPKYKLKR
jgi:hypothetical protein